MPDVKLTFLMEPVPKQRPQFGRRKNGKVSTFTPPKTVKATNFIKGEAAKQYQGKPMTGAIVAQVVFIASWPKSHKRPRIFPMHTKRPDIDNCLKLIFDALNGIVWVDDCQVVKVTVVKRYGDVPGIVVSVSDSFVL
jgi:Holliday junction resolvase RusA-like endonuclease